MRVDGSTIETGLSAIRNVELVNQALAMEICCNCRMSKRGSVPVIRPRASFRQTTNDSNNHFAGDQAVLKVMAAIESGGSWTLAFSSLILTVCNGWLQMAFGFS